ncbi:MAG: hypothetical protein MJZ82_01955 [Paludibacteraceae bacterium]|nr:hypothetical protein [Paludibacteraceae bacterium]
MSQLSFSFDEVPSTQRGSEKQVSNVSNNIDVTTSVVKVNHRETNITASILTALVDGGFFVTEEDEFDLHPILIDYAAEHGVKINLTLADAEECEQYEHFLEPFSAQFESAIYRLREAMENAKEDNDRTGFYSAEQYLNDVYYWYGINSVMRQEGTLSYSEFMRACKGFCNIYNLSY